MAEENQDGSDNDSQEDPGWIKDLRKKADRLTQVEAQLQQYEQEKQLREAGLELSDRQRKALLAAHEGDQTPDALKVTATELGFYTPPPEVQPEVQQGHETVAAASNGAQPAPSSTATDEYAAAQTPEEVMAIAEKRGTAVTWT
jgi:hypothetical protein